jgi:hypothetical protein
LSHKLFISGYLVKGGINPIRSFGGDLNFLVIWFNRLCHFFILGDLRRKKNNNNKDHNPNVKPGESSNYTMGNNRYMNGDGS